MKVSITLEVGHFYRDENDKVWYVKKYEAHPCFGDRLLIEDVFGNKKTIQAFLVYEDWEETVSF
jgi:hypothetical protein